MSLVTCGKCQAAMLPSNGECTSCHARIRAEEPPANDGLASEKHAFSLGRSLWRKLGYGALAMIVSGSILVPLEFAWTEDVHVKSGYLLCAGVGLFSLALVTRTRRGKITVDPDKIGIADVGSLRWDEIAQVRFVGPAGRTSSVTEADFWSLAEQNWTVEFTSHDQGGDLIFDAADVFEADILREVLRSHIRLRDLPVRF